MPDAILRLLQGPQGPALLLGLRAALLAMLALTAFALFSAPPARKGTAASHALLRASFACAFAAVLCAQAYWQIFGFTRPRFVRFLRRHNRRPNAAETQIRRGPLLDRRGFVLAAPVPGDVWGRRYPLGEAAVHPLGYFHPTYGITAVERAEDPVLSGCRPEGPPAPLARRLLAPRAKEGAAVTLTLDARLQRFAYACLGRRPGAAVALDPRTGDLLALVSSPGFDPLDPGPALRDAKNKPLFNRAVQGLYPPGSTFKLAIAAMALDCGRARPLECPGAGYAPAPGTPPIRDSEYYARARAGKTWPGWGRIGLKDALAHSSNVYFAQLAVSCGTDPFNIIVRKTRLNAPLRYLAGPAGDLQTARGRVPTIENPRLLAHPAIGQGDVMLTPLHIACLTAAVANGGILREPRLALPATPATGPATPGTPGAPATPAASPPPPRPGADPALPARAFSAAAARVIRAAMREAVTRGTARAADIPGLAVCGKTGTAQTSRGKDHAWFTCFAPGPSPALVVTVLIEHGGFGAAAALPPARKILEEARRLGYLDTAPRPKEEGRP